MPHQDLIQEMQRIYRDLPVGLCYLDTDLRFIQINCWLAEINGLPVDDHMGRRISEVLPDVAAGVESQLRQVLDTAEPIIGGMVDAETPAHPGLIRSFRHNYVAVKSDAGTVVGVSCVVEDITERRRAEEALRESEAMLRQAVETANLGHWVWDEVADECIYCSEKLAQMCGVTVEEYLARFGTMEALLKDVHPDDRARYERVIRDAKRDAVPYDIEFRDATPGGGFRYLRERGEPILDDEGKVVRTVGTLQDATDYKRTEEELAALNENLEKRVEERTVELRAAQAVLLRQERLAPLGQLTATVSHELRNPLGVIRTSSFVVRNGLKGEVPRVKRALERIDRSVIRCDRIIDELLDFTRIRDLEPEATVINVWLGDLLDEQPLPEGIKLCKEFGAPEASVSFDHDRFRRAVINVFENACQAITGKGDERAGLGKGVLTIKTRQSQGRAEVIFEDNGPGIAPDVLPRIFEPLFSTKGFGVGLGLPVVKRIMEQHGGGIEVETAEGRGTRIVLRLPTRRPEGGVS